MHELSIVMGIIDIAEAESGKAGGGSVEEIELDIGVLSTVQMEAFDFAWSQGVRDTLLQGTRLKVNRIGGEAECLDCGTVFPMRELYDGCPSCESRFTRILKGKELRVKSLTLDCV